MGGQRARRLRRGRPSERELKPQSFVLRGLGFAKRRSARYLGRARASLFGTAITPADLASALNVPTPALPDAVAAVRRGLTTRFPVIAAAAGNLVQHELRASADRICDHVFDLLGSGPIDLGERIDWHRDFKTGYRWDPRCYFADIPIGSMTGADIKVPWELSRGHQLVVLAQAWRLTGDPKYSREAARQFEDWLSANPPSFGVNWTCAMEVAIRAVNWLWALALLGEAEELSDGAFESILASLLAHGRHIDANLEIHSDGTTTNHYLANVVGLAYLGLCLPALREADAWRRFALRAMVSEMEKQVLPDGADYESSIPYHRLVAEMFLSTALLARRCGVALPPEFLDRLSRMVEFTIAYTKPNGLAPQIGDGDDGRLHILTGYGTVDVRDHRHLIAAGACLFGRDDWSARAGDRWMEALWLGGAATPPAPVPAPSLEHTSTAFEHAGIYVLRAHDDMVVFAAGPVGTDGLGNHKHNDVLAIEAHLGGEDVLVDAGSFVYTPDPAARDAFRSTRAHNTVMIDDAEQNRIPKSSLFSLHSDAVPRLVSWSAEPDGGAVCAEHNGYARLEHPVMHRRTARLVYPRQLFVEDTFDAQPDGSHRLAWTFAFAPGCRLVAHERGWVITTPRGAQMLLTQPCTPAGSPLEVVSEFLAGFVSPRYGVRHEAPVLRWTWKGSLPLSVRFHTEAVH